MKQSYAICIQRREEAQHVLHCRCGGGFTIDSGPYQYSETNIRPVHRLHFQTIDKKTSILLIFVVPQFHKRACKLMLAFSICVSIELLDMIVNISQIEYSLTVEYNIRHIYIYLTNHKICMIGY